VKYFVYLTTNLVNNKKYVGEHCSNDLNDSYLGSGIAVKKAIKKYGKRNFQREILEIFETKEEAFKAQEKYIQFYNTLSPFGYNFSPTGGLGVPGSLSADSLQKMKNAVSKANLGKPSHRKGKNISDTHRLNISKGIMGEHNPNFGGISESHRKNISLNHKVMIGKENPMYGKKHSSESKYLNKISHLKENLPEQRRKQMSNSAKNKPRIICKYCQESFTTSMHTRWHGEKCKNKINYVR